jgi:dihydrofolate reductase
MNNVTLDGVMQGPARPAEDIRDGFAHGGLGVAHSDEAMVAKMGQRLAELTGGNHAWLFGRWSYEQLLAYWNAQGGPFKDALNKIGKYGASSDSETKLDCPNSTLVSGDVPAAVAELKQRSAASLVNMGSGVLIGALMAAEMIDAYLLMIHPVVLGTGKRMFPEDTRVSLRLTDCATTSKGVVIITYEPVRNSTAAA